MCERHSIATANLQGFTMIHTFTLRRASVYHSTLGADKAPSNIHGLPLLPIKNAQFVYLFRSYLLLQMKWPKVSAHLGGHEPRVFGSGSKPRAQFGASKESYSRKPTALVC